MQNIFTYWPFTEYILPAILVFAMFFAILEKSNLLGEGKHQINAIISGVIALLLLSFPDSRDVVVNLVPFLVIVVMILFVFMLLYGFVSGEKKGDPLGKSIKIWIGMGVAIALAIAVMVITGTWDNFWGAMSGSSIGSNLLFIIIAIGAVVAVLRGTKSDDKDKD